MDDTVQNYVTSHCAALKRFAFNLNPLTLPEIKDPGALGDM